MDNIILLNGVIVCLIWQLVESLFEDSISDWSLCIFSFANFAIKIPYPFVALMMFTI